MMLTKKIVGSKGSRLKIKAGGGCRGEGAAPPPAMRTKTGAHTNISAEETSTRKYRWRVFTTTALVSTPKKTLACRKNNLDHHLSWLS